MVLNLLKIYFSTQIYIYIYIYIYKTYINGAIAKFFWLTTTINCYM